ncbi:hypothetical protein VV869_18800 [Photobacterium sp. MCCC 1A19761]|uniref:hypothetical protein n=1 Tax=Photobacterium sp. MCCC 1A19761 TaxID=3115000 RepID=UPI00307CF8BE
MDRKTIGFLLGLSGMALWFMPLAYIDFGGFGGMFKGVQLYQAGHHIGGIAYFLLFASASCAITAWFQLKPLATLSATVASAICVWFLVQAGTSAAWGLIGLSLVSISSLVLALKMNKEPALSEAS